MKINYFILIVIFCVSFLLSCEKEEAIMSSTSSTVKVISIEGGLKTGSTMLEFSSTTAFDSVLNVLDSLVDIREDNFLATWGHLSDSLLNAKEEELSYDEQVPISDFVTQMGFTNSMRDTYIPLEESWLNDTILDMATNPGNIYPFSPSEMALLNSYGEVKIGNSFIVLSDKGYVEFTDCDTTKLLQYRGGDTTVLSSQNVKYFFHESSGSCTSWKGQYYIVYENTKEHAIVHLHFRAYPWKGVSMAQITSYKFKNGKFIKYRTQLGVKNGSQFFCKDCFEVIFSQQKPFTRKKTKSLPQYIANWSGLSGNRAKKNESVCGLFEYYDQEFARTLTW